MSSIWHHGTRCVFICIRSSETGETPPCGSFSIRYIINCMWKCKKRGSGLIRSSNSALTWHPRGTTITGYLQTDVMSSSRFQCVLVSLQDGGLGDCAGRGRDARDQAVWEVEHRWCADQRHLPSGETPELNWDSRLVSWCFPTPERG